MSFITSPRSASVVLMAASLVAIGCSGGGGPKVHVEGNVTVDGNPLDAGFITFTCVEGNYSQTAGQIVNGRYAVNDVAPGKNQILVSVGSSSTGSAVDTARMAELGRKMRNMGRMPRNDSQKAAKMSAEARGASVAVSEETTGNKQVQEISTDRNQTIDVSLETVKGRKHQ